MIRRMIPITLCLLVSSPVLLGQFFNARHLQDSIPAHQEWGSQVLWSKGGESVITAGIDGNVRFWEVATGKKLREIRPAGAKSLLCAALSGDGELLVAGDAGGRLFWVDVQSGATRASTEPKGAAVNSISLGPTGRLLAAGYSDGFVRLWSTGPDGTPSICGEIKTGFGTVTTLALLTDTNRVVAGGYTRGAGAGELACWNWSTKEKLYRIPGTPACRSLTVSPDGRLMAAASFDPAVELFTLPGNKPDEMEIGTHVVDTQDDEGSVGVWETATGKVVAGLGAELGAGCLAFSGDGTLLACGGDHGVLVYEARLSSALREKGRINSRRRVGSLAFSPDGKKLVLLTENGLSHASPESGKRASERLSNPFLVAAASMLRDGLPLSRTDFGPDTVVTGGSSLDFWELLPLGSAEHEKVWQAMDLILSGKTEEASTALKSVIKAYASSVEARRLLAVIEGGADGNKLLEDALAIEPHNAALLRSRADSAHQSENFRNAVEWYRRALETSPDNGLVEGRLAAALLNSAMSELDPDSPEVLRKSIALLLEAIRIRPASARLHSNLGSLYYFMEDADRAIAATEEAIALDPLHSRAYYNLGHCYVNKGNRSKAVEAYRRYVALGEKGQEARVEKARALIAELSKQELTP